MRILLSAYSYTDIAMVCLHFQLVPRCCILLFNNIFCIHFQLLSYTDIALVDRYCYTDIAIRISIYGYWYTHFAIRILSCGYGYTECIFHVVQLYAYFHGMALSLFPFVRILPWRAHEQLGRILGRLYSMVFPKRSEPPMLAACFGNTLDSFVSQSYNVAF